MVSFVYVDTIGSLRNLPDTDFEHPLPFEPKTVSLNPNKRLCSAEDRGVDDDSLPCAVWALPVGPDDGDVSSSTSSSAPRRSFAFSHSAAQDIAISSS